MTKIGEGDQPPKMATVEMYHKELDNSALKFENTLDTYVRSTNPEERDHLKSLMDQHLQMIQQAVKEVSIKEIHKQGQKVSKDYENFIYNDTTENFSALTHDVQTLRDYNKISDLNVKK